MKQTPAHAQHNPDLLELIPLSCRKLVEVGCSTGALAREYRKRNPGCQYLGVDLDAGYAERARAHCDAVFGMDIEAPSAEFLAASAGAEGWIFGDALEHLIDPWQVLATVRARLPADGWVLACIPNAQHWSVQARLASGEFRYEDSGLMDRTHLRWFTRSTMIEMFQLAGLRIVEGRPRVFAEPEAAPVLAAIRALAEVCGANAEQAVADARPLQYVVRAVPL